MFTLLYTDDLVLKPKTKIELPTVMTEISKSITRKKVIFFMNGHYLQAFEK
jgi:hypothetical protein